MDGRWTDGRQKDDELERESVSGCANVYCERKHVCWSRPAEKTPISCRLCFEAIISFPNDICTLKTNDPFRIVNMEFVQKKRIDAV
ncbi:unnamed protein product [Angiostrongylus costaricensis]|uniref:Uncharacterized protein n=1 Tax=Angiostrongylus costaricensis TaxID=334426 RepID=A0A0R3PAH2_ANGCS|nr:unnamed protein product [Angiostrongylus costaricensis]